MNHWAVTGLSSDFEEKKSREMGHNETDLGYMTKEQFDSHMMFLVLLNMLGFKAQMHRVSSSNTPALVVN